MGLLATALSNASGAGIQANGPFLISSSFWARWKVLLRLGLVLELSLANLFFAAWVPLMVPLTLSGSGMTRYHSRAAVPVITRMFHEGREGGIILGGGGAKQVGGMGCGGMMTN